VRWKLWWLSPQYAMTCSLIITTYNWKDALDLVLLSVRGQTRMPDEVIVADDGSRPDTRQLLLEHARDFPVPLRHSWQEDTGFRAARSRNRAIAAATGEYIVLIDGDMVLHPDFIADHLWAAERGSFVQGMRVLTWPGASAKLLKQRRVRLRFFEPGIRRRRHTVHSRLLARLALATTRGKNRKGIKTCNQGWWRSDLEAVNGFDERFEGWGREDDDLAARAFQAGIDRRSLRFAGLATHLHHDERHQDGESANDAHLADNLARGISRAEAGLDRHFAEFAADPLPDLRHFPDPA
jgi:glycosyltransferase involved in cell wall biosynthesis